jgi:LDH2 family malate/lactate/ureidoglycolate dehydrogenase
VSAHSCDDVTPSLAVVEAERATGGVAAQLAVQRAAKPAAAAGW